MARQGGVDDRKQASPLYQGGSTNGPVGGPTGPPHTPDPFNYLNSPGGTAPGGSPAETPKPANNAPASHFGR